jgi:hypothetical protein
MTAPLIVASGAVLLLAGVGVAFAVRRRTGNTPPAVSSGTLPPSADERQQLILEIAALDERHDQKLLPEDAYQATRAALMRRVIELSADPSANQAASRQPARTA